MKKLLLLLLTAAILFFPPLSVYFAIQKAALIQANSFEEERERVIASHLDKLSMPLSADNRFQMNITRLSRKMHYENDEEGNQFYRNAMSEKAGGFFEKNAGLVLNNIDYPCELAFILRLSEDFKKMKVFRYGARLGVEQILQNFRQNATAGENPAWTGYFAATLEEDARSLISSSIIPFRFADGMRAIFSNSLGTEMLVLALADLQQVSWLESLKKKISETTDDFGIGCLIAGNPQPVFSQWFRDRPLLREKLARFFGKASGNTETAIIEGCKLQLGAVDSYRDVRLFSVTVPVAGGKTGWQTQHLILLLLAALSTLSFVVIGQKVLLNRGFDLPIRYLVPVIFLMLFIQPLFSMIYLANEYLQTSYSNIQSTTSEKLSEELQNLDQQTNDSFLNRINLVRALGSIEEISSFTSDPYTGTDDFTYCTKLLQKLDKKLLSRYFTSLWMCRTDGKFVAVSLRDDGQYSAESRESDFTGFFNERFVEILDYYNNDCRPVTGHRPEKLQDDLKGEYSRDFFLQLFGPDIFYNFRRYSTMFLNIDATYKKNKLLGMPITLSNRYHAFITWHMDERKASNDFPVRLLDLYSQSPRLAVCGNERNIDILEFELEKTETARPGLLGLAKTAHLNRSQISTVQKSDEAIVIEQAFPCNYSFYTVAGSETIASFAAYRRDFERKALIFLAALSLLSFALAMAGARYFTRPLRELTDATNQITAGNYNVEISENHPDEFAKIGGAFNRIALGLREGSLLKSFVTESVRREVVGQEIDELAEKSELRNATIVFAGICDFAAFQIEHDEHETFALLQKLLQASDAATRQFGGEIDKMIEDKIMIVFEHHGKDEPFYASAINTALFIGEQVFAQTGHRVAAGVNTGVTVAGIMGAAEARLSRTVIGDPVNLSARLASLAGKMPDGGTVISGTLVDAVPAGYKCEKLPVSSVKGKTQSIEAWLIKQITHQPGN
ncbi:MAG: hypothetical protein A2W80_08245 [Candidatus Riflebacteria bacterium GWC2_50_8]|nr:MAG: hypothetical protein A2W80_08245 [Candidatus Riflebacteria bacterium GWC2_50_8]